MTIDLVSHDQVQVEKEDKRNSKKRFLRTDAVCVTCGSINNHYWYDSCIICMCKCGSAEFISGKLIVDLRSLMDLKLEQIESLCEVRNIRIGSKVHMIIRLLQDFDKKIFDKRVDELLIRKIIKRNKKKFRFTVDLVQTKSSTTGFKLKLLDAKDVRE